MATLGRSLKPSSFLMSSGKRPGMGTRSMSASSLSSASSNDDAHQMHFVLSGTNTPISENVPAASVGPRSPTVFAGLDRGPTPSPIRSPRSQPITIEVPAIRRFGASPASTPPEPLSARGDLQGGYFPNHEDKNRVRRPHPFQPETRLINARLQSAQPVLDTRPAGPPQATMASAAFGTTFVSDSTHLHPLRSAVDAAMTQPLSQPQTHTPVASYNPSGVGDYQLPMGKYYPSNYESRNPRSQPPTRSVTHLGPAPFHLSNLKSDSHVPTVGIAHESGPTSSISQHTRSEAKRRLQQYQRDMVAQATLAANKALGAHGSARPQAAPVSKASAADRPPSGSSSTSTSTVRNLHLPGSSKLAAAKPTSPRLQPLGSPGGPVTPMDLGTGGEDGGYLSARPMSGPDAERHQEEVTRALARAEDESRRHDVSSPSALV